MSLLHQHDLAPFLPHRFENFLIDTIERDTGRFNVSLVNGDPEGRGVVLKTGSDGASRLISPFFMEIGALASISCVGASEEGKIAVFAAISKFEKVGFIDPSAIAGHVKDMGVRGQFYSFQTRFESETGHVSGSVMAYYAEASVLGESDEKKKLSLPEFNCDIAVHAPSFKSKDLFVLERICFFDPDSFSAVGSYLYPEDHIFTKGHFPGNPIMMGVMQWMMVSDLGLFLKDKGGNGCSRLTCNAEVVKADGVIACEIKGAVLDLDDNAEVLASKKVIFRDIVRPGETLFCFVHDVVFELIE